MGFNFIFVSIKCCECQLTKSRFFEGLVKPKTIWGKSAPTYPSSHQANNEAARASCTVIVLINSCFVIL